MLRFLKKISSRLSRLSLFQKSQVQLYPAMHEDNVKNFVSFCYKYFEDLLALITFAKNFGVSADVVSKIFAVENTLQSKINFRVMHLQKVIYYVIVS